MKIFAIINNYVTPGLMQAECGGGQIHWYQMADSSILRSGNPFFVPDFDSRFMAYPSVVYRIGRLGKSIAPRFAERYIDGIGVGVAIVAENLLAQLKAAGLPWSKAVSFDRSFLLGNLLPFDTLIDNKDFEFEISNQKINYSTDCLRHGIRDLIAAVSRDNTVKNGDLILAGLTPAGINLCPGCKITARAHSLNTNILDINIK